MGTSPLPALARTAHTAVGTVLGTLVALSALLTAQPATSEAGGGAFLRSMDEDHLTTYRQVTWKDFKASLPLRGSAQARIFTGIRMEGLDMEVAEEGSKWVARPSQLVLYAYMDKTRSSAKPGGQKPSVLAHEQLHFDITEVFARRLNRQIAEIEGRGASAHAAMAELNRRVDEIYDDSLKRWQETQDRYDRETRHGMSKRQQKAWSDRIHGWLEETRHGQPRAR